MDRHIFHLAFPVTDLETSRWFYVDVLGGTVGRTTPRWLDILLWGHQLTLHHRPDEVPPREPQGKRHFGVVLPWQTWQLLADQLTASDIPLLHGPVVLEPGTPQEQAKLHLQDPDGYIIEIKAYRDFDAVMCPRDEAGDSAPT